MQTDITSKHKGGTLVCHPISPNAPQAADPATHVGPLAGSSLAPHTAAQPHRNLDLKIDFEVDGGESACIDAPLQVKYSPEWYLLILTVALGSLVGHFMRRGLVAAPAHGSHAARGGEAPARAEAAPGTIHPFLTILIGVVSWVTYWLGQRAGRFVGTEPYLDLMWLPASLVIGILVGLTARWHAERLHRVGQALLRILSGQHLGVLLVFTGLLPCSVWAGSFRPVSLAVDPHTGAVLVLSSPENVLYKIVGEQRPEFVTQLDRYGIATDLCVGGEGPGAWFAVTLATRVGGFRDVWRSTFLLGQVEELLRTKGGWVRNPDKGRWGLYASLACTSDGRLLVLDVDSAAVRSFRVSGGRQLDADDPQPRGYVRSSTLAFAGGDYILGSVEAGGVAAFDSRFRKIRTLAEEVDDPAGMSVTPDTGALLIADAARRRILRVDLRRDNVEVLLKEPELQTPADVVQDAQGTLWIADPGARAVFRFRDGELTRIDMRPPPK